MTDTVIKVENLSKLYRLGEVGTGTLSHCLPRIGGDLNRFWARLRGKEDPFAKVGRINPDRHQDTRKSDKEKHIHALKSYCLIVEQLNLLDA